MTAMRQKAEILAMRFKKRGFPADFYLIRDAVDLATCGDFDCVQLDILASMVARRLKGTIEA